METMLPPMIVQVWSSVNWIHPDVNLKKFAVLPNVELDDMTLLHENDVHFNLVVSRDSDLVKLGSLSYRFNIGPLAKKKGQGIQIRRGNGDTGE